MTSVYLYLTASNPVCLQLMTSEESFQIDGIIETTGSVNYSGNWSPVMKWQQDGGPVITVDVVNNTVLYKSVTSSVRAADVKGSKFSCTTYFSEDKPNQTTSAPLMYPIRTSHGFGQILNLIQTKND